MSQTHLKSIFIPIYTCECEVSVRPQCNISLEPVDYPVLTYLQDGGQTVSCAARYHIDAICTYIAHQIIRQEAIDCPTCRRRVDGIRLDLGQVSYVGEESMEVLAIDSVAVRSLAGAIAFRFRERNVVDGQPAVQELTMAQMRQIKRDLDNPPWMRDEMPHEPYLSTAGSIAVLAATLFGMYLFVKFFSPEEVAKKKMPHRGTLVDVAGLKINNNNF